jgi:hypothetical protein
MRPITLPSTSIFVQPIFIIIEVFLAVKHDIQMEKG